MGTEGTTEEEVKLDRIYTLIPPRRTGHSCPFPLTLILLGASAEASGDRFAHPSFVRCCVATSLTVWSGGICQGLLMEHQSPASRTGCLPLSAQPRTQWRHFILLGLVIADEVVIRKQTNKQGGRDSEGPPRALAHLIYSQKCPVWFANVLF